jgi:hypothetical protein
MTTTQNVREQIDALAKERAEYDAWVTRSRGSLLGGLNADIDGRIVRLRSNYEKALADSEPEKPGNNRLVRAQKKLQRSWAVSLVIWPVLMLVIIALAFRVLPGVVNDALVLMANPQPDRSAFIDQFGFLAGIGLWIAYLIVTYWWVFLIAFAVILAVSLILANHAYYKENRRYFREVSTSIARNRHKVERTIYYGTEASRLEQLAPVLADWTKITGNVLHRPYGDPKRVATTIEPNVVESFPASFGVAQAEENPNTPKAIIAKTTEVLYPKGWATRAFEQSLNDFHLASGHDVEDAANIDLDGPVSIGGPRSDLREYWASGAASTSLASRGVEAVKDAVINQDIVLSPRIVTRLGEHGDSRPIRESEFYKAVGAPSQDLSVEMLSDEARVQGKQEVSQSYVWLPAGLKAGDQSESTDRRIGGSASALRADISRPMLPTELALFAGDEGEPEVLSVVADDDGDDELVFG